MSDATRGERSVRILVADDFAQWRAGVRAILQAPPEWQIIGEACDGLAAVQITKELLPDIIVLDLGMPVLNGIEAAKLIRQDSPRSKIIFAMQNLMTRRSRQRLSPLVQKHIC